MECIAELERRYDVQKRIEFPRKVYHEYPEPKIDGHTGLTHKGEWLDEGTPQFDEHLAAGWRVVALAGIACHEYPQWCAIVESPPGYVEPDKNGSVRL